MSKKSKEKELRIVNEELRCTRDDANKHSINSIKFLFSDEKKKKNKRNLTKEQLVGHVPEPLSLLLDNEGMVYTVNHLRREMNYASKHFGSRGWH